ncbi:hypothetical protein C0993_000966 [Termitomyces sp. T159_Od127]|nr:hypothetical protein C0993_000966 [Termitomyces sp. T159_Od127]
MGPTRTGEPSSSQARKPRRHKDPAAVPGVQKIKAALRQARRLVAKDKLAANVRVETERRIRALEADLAQAEVARAERANATRYHKVKFFERKKVVRRLTQTKKRLESTADDDDASKPRLLQTLADLRVDLNYILHYPKTKKYISLFPPALRADAPQPQPPENPESQDVRKWIKARMDAGELPAEPELHLDVRMDARTPADWGAGSRPKAPKKEARGEEEEEDEDAFFGDDTDEDGE